MSNVQQNLPVIARANLLRIANALMRKEMLNEAYILYELLDQVFPEFSQYRWLKQHCGRKLKSIGLKPPKGLNNSLSILSKQDAYLIRGLNTSITSTEIAGQELGVHHVERVISSFPACHHKTCLQINLSALKRDSLLWSNHINCFFNAFGMSGVDINCDATIFDHPTSILQSVSFIKPNADHKQSLVNPKVSIFISAFNAENTISQAVQSLLDQTHKNLEIIICDDNSSDSTPKICAELARHSTLIKLIKNKAQMGTYVNRNMGLELATGDFFTILDADDIAHPSRMAMQLDMLVANQDLIGVIGHWIRLSNRGYIGFRNFWGGTYLHEAVATFMFRREAVMRKIGYWDEVMFSADTEFLERVRRVFGDKSVKALEVPLCIASQVETSLTNNKKTGISNFQGLSDVRLQYRRSWTEWHNGAKTEDLYIAKGQDRRMFDAPVDMMPSLKRK